MLLGFRCIPVPKRQSDEDARALALFVSCFFALVFGTGSLLYVIAMEVGLERHAVPEEVVPRQIGQWAPVVVEALIVVWTIVARITGWEVDEEGRSDTGMSSAASSRPRARNVRAVDEEEAQSTMNDVNGNEAA